MHPVSVETICITFQEKGDNRFFPHLYGIEMTDVSRGRFDRLLIQGRYYPAEAICTINESSQIRGALDVVKLTNKMPEVRIQKIPTDLPKIIAGQKSDYLFSNG